MDLIRLHIPYSFIRHRTRLAWRDVRFGFVNEIIDPHVPIELAIDRIIECENPPESLVDLAGASKDDPILHLVDQLACEEPEGSDEETRDKWLYLVLAWGYEYQEALSDPLDWVTLVYADFDYPAQIVKFVKFMPTDEPPPESADAAEIRLFEHWKQYLEESATRYST